MLRSFDYPRHTCLPPIQARISAELEQDESGLEGWKMHGRQMIIPYALEDAPRPGAREIRVRRPPDGFRIRNERGAVHEGPAD